MSPWPGGAVTVGVSNSEGRDTMEIANLDSLHNVCLWVSAPIPSTAGGRFPDDARTRYQSMSIVECH